MVAWQHVVLYFLLFLALFVYLQLSKMRVAGRPLIGFKYRVVIALFFPFVLVIGFILSYFILAMVLTLLLLGWLVHMIQRR